jgi:predicted DCC family thiol-disulfide oxidoreductase YuxK
MGSNFEIIEKSPVIFFDGVCNLCNGAVNFIISRDKDSQFKFSSLQSSFASQHLAAHLAGSSLPDSIVFLAAGQAFFKSAAVFEIARKLGGGWKLLTIFKILPQAVTDAIYDLIARNRYSWFGRSDACRVPTPELKARFLDS